MSVLLAAVLCLLGWALLATAQRGQRRRLRLTPLSKPHVAWRRAAGVAGLVAALVSAVMGLGPSLGVVYWFAMLGCCGLAVSVTLGFAVARQDLR